MIFHIHSTRICTFSQSLDICDGNACAAGHQESERKRTLVRGRVQQMSEMDIAHQDLGEEGTGRTGGASHAASDGRPVDQMVDVAFACREDIEDGRRVA